MENANKITKLNIIKIINSKIRNKLIFGFVFISLIVVIVSYFSLRTLKNIEYSYRDISKKSLPLIQYLDEMKFSSIRLVASAAKFGYLTTESNNISVKTQLEEEDKQIQQSCVSCHTAFSQYKQILIESFPDEVDQINNIKTSGNLLHTSATDFIKAKRIGISGAEALEKKELMETGEIKFLEAIDLAIKGTNNRLIYEKSQLETIISSSLKYILLISGLTFLISIIIGVLISQNISKPIIKLTQFVNNFKKGDMNSIMNIKSGDEIGVLINSFNEMAERIKQLISQLEDEILLVKQSEEKLRESEVNLNVILESTADGILAVDSKGKVIKTNNRFIELWRIPQMIVDSGDDNKLLGLVLDQLIDAEEFLSKVRILYNSMENDLDYLHFKDGRIFERFSSPLQMPDSSLGRVWSFRDITAQKSAEKAIKESEEKYRTLIETMSDGVYRSTHEGRFTEVNPALVRILGYDSKEELLAIDIKTQLYFAEEERESADLEEKLEEMAIFRLRRKDGSEVWVEDHGRHVLDEEGNILYHEGALRDVTDRKQEEKLSNALFDISEAVNHAQNIYAFYQRIHEIIKRLMQAENFYIALYDENDNLISFPYYIDEFDEGGPPVKPGKGCTEYVLRNGKAIIIDKTLLDELNRTEEIEMIGTLSTVWLGVPLKIEEKIIGVMVVQDYKNEKAYGEKEKKILVFVSEHVAAAIYKKRTEEDTKRHTAELVELNNSKDKFFSIIAHDLKSPFNSILGFSELLDERLKENDYENAKKYAEIIQKSSNRAMDLLMNLMEWSQSQTGRIEFNPAYFEIVELINETTLLLSDTAKQKSINITKFLPSNIPIYADRAMISTVLRNLISNAIKFVQPGGKITISAEEQQSELIISVGDSGIGIKKDRIDKLFQLDESQSTPGTLNEKGTGLGLILCKEFIDKHSGKIWAESEEGKGSTFYFTGSIS